MSRTNKKSVPVWYRKEKKEYRKRDYQKYRKKTKKMARDGQEEYPQYVKTSGHLTH